MRRRSVSARHSERARATPSAPSFSRVASRARSTRPISSMRSFSCRKVASVRFSSCSKPLWMAAAWSSTSLVEDAASALVAWIVPSALCREPARRSCSLPSSSERAAFFEICSPVEVFTLSTLSAARCIPASSSSETCWIFDRSSSQAFSRSPILSVGSSLSWLASAAVSALQAFRPSANSASRCSLASTSFWWSATSTLALSRRKSSAPCSFISPSCRESSSSNFCTMLLRLSTSCPSRASSSAAPRCCPSSCSVRPTTSSSCSAPSSGLGACCACCACSARALTSCTSAFTSSMTLARALSDLFSSSSLASIALTDLSWLRVMSRTAISTMFCASSAWLRAVRSSSSKRFWVRSRS
mmetsp:Transcript_59836/g.155400  ORF Transcript_59836/g.155400 Transcript_59836/m.155400 type:complete len:358 (-) Transcript_59836:417-1490(-)